MKMWLKQFYATFVYLSIFWPSDHTLAFERFVRTLDSQIDLFGSIIIMYECYETNFAHFDLLLCNLAFLAKSAAFLALRTLKLQNTEITWLEIPNGPNDREKSLFFVLRLSGLQNDLWDLHWPFSIFLVFLMSYKATRIKNYRVFEH